MPRITPEKVGLVIDHSLTAGEMTSYIEMANEFVNHNLGLGTGYPLDEIETLMAAHFITAFREPEADSVSVMGVKVSRTAPDMGAGLKATQYGQQAIVLDTTGKLARLGKLKAKVQMV